MTFGGEKLLKEDAPLLGGVAEMSISPGFAPEPGSVELSEDALYLLAVVPPVVMRRWLQEEK